MAAEAAPAVGSSSRAATSTRTSRLTEARRAAGLTRVELAERIGVTPATVVGWEDASLDPSLSELLRSGGYVRTAKSRPAYPPRRTRSRERRHAGPDPLGTSLRELRVAAGMSQRALARRLGRSHSVVSRWEAGILEPTLLDLGPLVRACGRGSVDRLVADSALVPRGRRWSSRAHGRRERRTLGVRLWTARLRSGVSLGALYRAGLSGRRVLAAEAGADLCLAELRLLRGLLGLDLDELSKRPGLDKPDATTTLPHRADRPTSQTPRRLPKL